MRNTVCILLLILTGCHSGNNFLLRGQLPDNTYDGEVIYLVPLENAVKERVDSARIKDGTFAFEGIATVPEIYIIRAKPVLRFNLEELLVVRESGTLLADIGKSSSVTGTALNDSLQRWKEKKMMFDIKNAELIKQFRTAEEPLKPEIEQRADSLQVDRINFHFNFVRNNRENIVGQLVQKIMAGSFTEEQMQQLNGK